eukprot:6174658-Pleurochrysis_carterae.AAC.2
MMCDTSESATAHRHMQAHTEDGFARTKQHAHGNDSTHMRTHEQLHDKPRRTPKQPHARRISGRPLQVQKHTTPTPGAARAPGPRKISCRGHGQALALTLDLSDVAFHGNRTNMLTRSTAAVPKTCLSVTQTCGA